VKWPRSQLTDVQAHPGWAALVPCRKTRIFVFISEGRKPRGVFESALSRGVHGLARMATTKFWEVPWQFTLCGLYVA